MTFDRMSGSHFSFVKRNLLPKGKENGNKLFLFFFIKFPFKCQKFLEQVATCALPLSTPLQKSRFFFLVFVYLH